MRTTGQELTNATGGFLPTHPLPYRRAGKNQHDPPVLTVRRELSVACLCSACPET
jgi:hypothetical protein